MCKDVIFGKTGELHPKSVLQLLYDAEGTPGSLQLRKHANFTLACRSDGFSSHLFCVYNPTMECSKILFLSHTSMLTAESATKEINDFFLDCAAFNAAHSAYLEDNL